LARGNDKTDWRIKHRVDDLFRATPLKPVHAGDVSEAPLKPPKGQLLIIDHGAASYWFDGREWIPVAGGAAGRHRLRVRFPERLAHQREPLLVAGLGGATRSTSRRTRPTRSPSDSSTGPGPGSRVCRFTSSRAVSTCSRSTWTD